MTGLESPRADQRVRERELGPAYAPRGQSGPAQALARLRAMLGRQGLLFLLVAVAVASLGYFIVGFADPFRTPSPIFWAGLGACAGAAAALTREFARDTVTSAAAIARYRGFALLGAAPELSAAALRALPPQHRTLLGCLMFAPASAFATAFRDLQGALAEDRVVAFVAATADDGSSTSAMCAAASAAQQGRRVVLVDCDVRRRSLTETLGIEADAGVREAALAPESWGDIVSEEPEIGFAVLPAARGGARFVLAETPGWPALLENLGAAFDLVVLDCPSAPSPDATALAARADRVVIVAAWDRTPRAALRRTLRLIKASTKGKAGVFVNRVPEGRRFGRLRPG
jgi:Mrp family chromosome partitioning ATPase